jgi:formylglycine-generating enzyme required for sulfatase activity
VDRYSPDPKGPINGPSWYDAAAFCNWLSDQEGLPKDQWCYLPAENGQYSTGMTIPADGLQRTGYRLPTEAEWEYACRSGTVTSRYHGFSTDLLDGYVRYQVNSKDHAWMCGSLRPNDLGLFDMLGNVHEWVKDEYHAYEAQAISDDIKTISHIDESPRLLRGGAFSSQPAVVRSAFRVRYAPAYRDADIGFRPSRTYP